MSVTLVDLWRRAWTSNGRLERTVRTGILCSFTLLAAPAANECGPPPTGADPTEESTGKVGTCTYATYTSGFADSPAFGEATIYYPTNVAPPFAGVAVAPGWAEVQVNTAGWGRFLGSHCFVVMTFDMNDKFQDLPDKRATALLAAVDTLKAENARGGSPLFGKMHPDRYAIMGHSMGGGGTLIAAQNTRTDIRAAIPYTPWNSSTNFSGVRIPTLIMGATSESLAPTATHAWPFYQSIDANRATAKAYIQFATGDHGVANDPLYPDPNNPGDNQKVVGRWALSWLKVYVLQDARYQQFLRWYPVLESAPRYEYIP